MGDMADYYMDLAMDACFEHQHHINRNIRLSRWKTASGASLFMKDMTEDHINNTIKMIKDARIDLDGLEEDYVKAFENELKRRQNEKRTNK